MINQTIVRNWGAILSMLSPGSLIDRLLDKIDELSGLIVPAQAVPVPCKNIRIETRRDQFGA